MLFSSVGFFYHCYHLAWREKMSLYYLPVKCVWQKKKRKNEKIQKKKLCFSFSRYFLYYMKMRYVYCLVSNSRNKRNGKAILNIHIPLLRVFYYSEHAHDIIYDFRFVLHIFSCQFIICFSEDVFLFR